jgi:hypothetical protein
VVEHCGALWPAFVPLPLRGVKQTEWEATLHWIPVDRPGVLLVAAASIQILHPWLWAALEWPSSLPAASLAVCTTLSL